MMLGLEFKGVRKGRGVGIVVGVDYKEFVGYVGGLNFGCGLERFFSGRNWRLLDRGMM